MWVISSMPWGNMGEASATGEGAVKQAWWPTHLMRGAGPLEREGSIIQREAAKEREKEGGSSGWHVFKVYDTVFKRMEASRKTAHRSGIISEQQHRFCCVRLSDMPQKTLLVCQYLPGTVALRQNVSCFCSQVSSLWPHMAAVWAGAASHRRHQQVNRAFPKRWRSAQSCVQPTATGSIYLWTGKALSTEKACSGVGGLRKKKWKANSVRFFLG